MVSLAVESVPTVPKSTVGPVVAVVMRLRWVTVVPVGRVGIMVVGEVVVVLATMRPGSVAMAPRVVMAQSISGRSDSAMDPYDIALLQSELVESLRDGTDEEREEAIRHYIRVLRRDSSPRLFAAFVRCLEVCFEVINEKVN